MVSELVLGPPSPRNIGAGGIRRVEQVTSTGTCPPIRYFAKGRTSMAELSAQPVRINYRRYHRQRLEFADIPLSLWLGWTVLLIAWPVAEILMDLQALSVDEVI